MYRRGLRSSEVLLGCSSTSLRADEGSLLESLSIRFSVRVARRCTLGHTMASLVDLEGGNSALLDNTI